MEEIKEKIFKENIPRWAYILLIIFIYFIIGIMIFFAWGVCNVSAIAGQTSYIIPNTNEIFMYYCSSTTNCDGNSIPLEYIPSGYVQTQNNITVTAGSTIDIYIVTSESLIKDNYYTLNHYISVIQNGQFVSTNYLVGAIGKISLVNRTSNWYNTIYNGGTMTNMHTYDDGNNYNYYTYITTHTFQADRTSNYIHSQITFSQSGTYKIYYNGYKLTYNGQYNETLTSSQVQTIVQQQNQTQTQTITENQDANTEEQIESQEVCKLIGYVDVKTTGKQLNGYGQEINRGNGGITDYIQINSKNTLTRKSTFNYGDNLFLCYYDKNKTLISCLQETSSQDYNEQNKTYTIPSNASYVRFTINMDRQEPSFEICGNGNQEMNQSLLDMADKIHETNNQLEATFTPENPNTSDFDELEDIETDLHTYTDVDLDTMDVDIDTDTSSWVWTTITSLLNTSSQVFGMVISILSIGIIKLILAR